jgi:hypothetical protein
MRRCRRTDSRNAKMKQIVGVRRPICRAGPNARRLTRPSGISRSALLRRVESRAITGQSRGRPYRLRNAWNEMQWLPVLTFNFFLQAKRPLPCVLLFS